jgi:Putative bacterial sensory transduction regulator
LDVEVPTIEPLSHGLIDGILRKRNLRFMTDSDGDFKIEYSRDPDSGVEITVWVLISGKNGNILQFRVYADTVIRRTRWSEAISLCNEWNEKRLWPKVYLYARNPDTDEVARLQCEVNLDLAVGTFAEFVDDQYILAVATASLFFEWLHQEKNFI